MRTGASTRERIRDAVAQQIKEGRRPSIDGTVKAGGGAIARSTLIRNADLLENGRRAFDLSHPHATAKTAVGMPAERRESSVPRATYAAPPWPDQRGLVRDQRASIRELRATVGELNERIARLVADPWPSP